jgi:hypothetical protein
MKDKETESGIAALLAGNENLRQDWVQPPQVAHIPFMGTRKNFFVLVNVHVKPEANDKERLLNKCVAAAQLVIGSGLASGLKGFEIAAFVDVPEQRNPRRVFRLSVLDTAFAQAMQIAAGDLLHKQHSGITRQWPLQPPR